MELMGMLLVLGLRALGAGSFMFLVWAAAIAVDASETTYAQQYDETRFDELKIGASADEVRSSIGNPLDEGDLVWLEQWCYDAQHVYVVVGYGVFDGRRIYDSVFNVVDPEGWLRNRLKDDELSPASIKSVLGEPDEIEWDYEGVEGWYYSRSPDNSSYHERVIYFDSKEMVVVRKKKELYID